MTNHKGPNLFIYFYQGSAWWSRFRGGDQGAPFQEEVLSTSVINSKCYICFISSIMYVTVCYFIYIFRLQTVRLKSKRFSTMFHKAFVSAKQQKGFIQMNQRVTLIKVFTWFISTIISILYQTRNTWNISQKQIACKSYIACICTYI